MDEGLAFLSSLTINFYFASPHMDEIFHLRQLEVYLANDFWTWDEKITTLPGLYMFFYVFLSLFPIHKVFNLLFVCRVLNSLMLVPIGYLAKLKNPHSKSLVLLYPPLFMASCLYYTDTLSLLSVLIFDYYLQKDFLIAEGLLAVFSIFCRQTNVIWIGYFTGLKIFKHYKIENFKSLSKLFRNIKNILLRYISEIVIFAMFLIFFYVNKGITVGDKENHKPGMHLAQLCYLFILTALYIPIDSHSLHKAFRSLQIVIIFPLCLWILADFSYTHSFLLSDNSHYVFYIWKNFLGPYRLYMAPLCGVSLLYISKSQKVQFYWWLFCSSLVLVPSTLLELRYFILPLATYILENNTSPSLLRIIFLWILNLFTIFIFTFKPYKAIPFMW